MLFSFLYFEYSDILINSLITLQAIDVFDPVHPLVMRIKLLLETFVSWVNSRTIVDTRRGYRRKEVSKPGKTGWTIACWCSIWFLLRLTCVSSFSRSGNICSLLWSKTSSGWLKEMKSRGLLSAWISAGRNPPLYRSLLVNPWLPPEKSVIGVTLG